MPLTLYELTANKPSFKTTRFERGFNVVLAERTKESTKNDTRNGLGKSTLIKLINFCLGGNLEKELTSVLEKRGWKFFLRVELNGHEITISRGFDAKSIVTVLNGNDVEWPIVPTMRDGNITFTQREWNLILGHMLFGLDMNSEKYSPSYRSLISYLIRHSKEAYLSPFEHHRRQLEWDKQVHNAFLLGLNWEDAREWQFLRDKKKELVSLRDLAKSDAMSELMGGSLGELQALKVRLQSQVEEGRENLQNYKVHPQYQVIQDRANNLTREIHELINDNVSDERLLAFYFENLDNESEASSIEIRELYRSAGVQLPGVICRRLEEAEDFHRKIIENRRDFLKSEIETIQRRVEKRKRSIDEKSVKRSDLLRVLSTHGALEEYSQMQQVFLESVEELNRVVSAIETLKKIQEGKISFRIEEDNLRQKAQADYNDRISQASEAIALFNQNSRFLYSSPGSLIVDITQKGYKFNVEIERSGSIGIDSMKILCYDLMLAEIWARKEVAPKLAIHDNIIFSGVDERQIALGIELACMKASQRGFQYICTLNTDEIPEEDFSESFDISHYVRQTLTDTRPDGSLLGFRF